MEPKKTKLDWKSLVVSSVMASFIFLVVHFFKDPCPQRSSTPICDILVNISFWLLLTIVFYLFKKRI